MTNSLRKVPAQRAAKLWVYFVVLCACLCEQRDALSQAVSISTGSDAGQMVAELRVAMDEHDSVQIKQISRDLHALGGGALPAIREVLPECSESETGQFIRILGGIGGRDATEILVQLACQPENRKAASWAIAALENRIIDFALTDEQVESVVLQIRKRDVVNAGAAARFLSLCVRNDRRQMTGPVLERFIDEITNPTELAPMHGAYVSPRVYVLNQFLLAFANLGAEAVPALKAALEQVQEDETRRWLTLALGMCGERSVAEDIESFIRDDPDIYFRAAAVRAYAQSAGQDAIPLLQELVKDKSESEYDRLPDGTPVRPISLVAQDQLVRLEQLGAEDDQKKSR